MEKNSRTFWKAISIKKLIEKYMSTGQWNEGMLRVISLNNALTRKNGNATAKCEADYRISEASNSLTAIADH